ncbi:MAG: hypothetical protein JWN61_2287 [Pseudonocardiales bacterium]|nr:hypothetical protein [Pseudonocardiales bacterium]
MLVVTSTLRSGWPAGALSACAPLISDLLLVGGVLAGIALGSAGPRPRHRAPVVTAGAAPGRIAVAVLVASGRHRLSITGYRRALLGAGILLAVAGAALLLEFAPQLS